jgi:hypothetical protein
MSNFVDALIAEGAAAEHSSELELFGRFVGEWQVDNRSLIESTAEWVESRFRWVFAWVLDGRGVQDVIVGANGRASGTTLRVFDPALNAWRVYWFGVAGGDYCDLRAVADGPDAILLDGVQTDGRRIRWQFSGITADSFAWDGRVSNDGGVSWWDEQHMDARRVR